MEDPDRHYRPSLFVIRSAHPAVELYRSARQEMLNKIIDTIGLGWSSLSLFKIGRTLDQAVPTVVVMVESHTIADWSQLKAALEDILNPAQSNAPTELKQEKDRRLTVEIMPGRAGNSEGETESRGRSMFNDTSLLKAHPRPGTSIRIRGEEGVGSLGGGFRLMTSMGTTHHGFLTSAKVATPAFGTEADDPTAYETWGVPYNAERSPWYGTLLEYFSDIDIAASITDGNEKLQKLQARRKDLVEAEASRNNERPSTDRQSAEHKRLISSLDNTIRDYEDSLTHCNRMPYRLGFNILSSGQTLTAHSKTLDYAFVETDSAYLTIKNEVPDFPFPDHISRTLKEKGTIDAFSRIEPDGWYFKVGRTTGVTCGLCNGVDSWVKPPQLYALVNRQGVPIEFRQDGRPVEVDVDGLPLRDDNGNVIPGEGDAKYQYSSELVILSQMTIETGATETVTIQGGFCAPGDYGAMIVDENGAAGLLWGGLSGGCGPLGADHINVGAGLVTDIKDIRDAMKVALGYKPDDQIEVLYLPSRSPSFA